jgi:hypothetical protein
MRRPIALFVAILGAMFSGEAKAQYTQGYVQNTAPRYVYAYPTIPTYVPSYPTVVTRRVRPPNPTGYRNRPYYGAYGYGNYSNGSTDGFPPFRGRWSR